MVSNLVKLLSSFQTVPSPHDNVNDDFCYCCCSGYLEMRLDDDKDEDDFTNYYGGNRKFVREGVEGKQKLDGKLED